MRSAMVSRRWCWDVGSKRPKQLHPRMLGEFKAAGVPLKRKLWECQVTEDALLPVGTVIGQLHTEKQPKKRGQKRGHEK